jgi:hypothetical protein
VWLKINSSVKVAKSVQTKVTFFNEAEHVSDEESDNNIEQDEPEPASSKCEKPMRSNCQWIRCAKPLFMISATMRNSVITVARSCIRWVHIKMKSLSSFLLK